MSNYIPNKLLKETVERRDTYDVRGALVALILTDSSFDKGIVYQAIKYAEDNVIDVYQEHDPAIELIENSIQWDEEYFAKVANQLRRNFSKERLSHLEKVGKKVYATHTPVENKSTATPKVNVLSNRTSQHSTTRTIKTDPNKNFLTGRQALAIVAAGIAMAAIIILITKK